MKMKATDKIFLDSMCVFSDWSWKYQPARMAQEEKQLMRVLYTGSLAQTFTLPMEWETYLNKLICIIIATLCFSTYCLLMLATYALLFLQRKRPGPCVSSGPHPFTGGWWQDKPPLTGTMSRISGLELVTSTVFISIVWQQETVVWPTRGCCTWFSGRSSVFLLTISRLVFVLNVQWDCNSKRLCLSRFWFLCKWWGPLFPR